MEACIVKLEALKREEGKNPRQLRSMGLLPVTIYGKELNLNVAVNTQEFKLAYKKDKNTKFEISYDGKTYLTETKNVQVNYATNEIQSVEFSA